MIGAISTVPAGCLIYFVLVDLSLGNTSQCFAVVLELLFPVALGYVGWFPLFPIVI
jgi:hypothetical protein